MSAIEHLTIGLPAEVAAKVRYWVAMGDYPDVDAAVLEALLDLEAQQADPVSDAERAAEAEWFRREGLPALERCIADPSRVLTMDQVRERMGLAREARRC